MKRILILLPVSLLGLVLIAGCSGAGSYPDGDSRYESFAPDGIPFKVTDTPWAIDQRGNHRAVVSVKGPVADGVVADLHWRRPDPRLAISPHLFLPISRRLRRAR